MDLNEELLGLVNSNLPVAGITPEALALGTQALEQVLTQINTPVLSAMRAQEAPTDAQLAARYPDLNKVLMEQGIGFTKPAPDNPPALSTKWDKVDASGVYRKKEKGKATEYTNVTDEAGAPTMNPAVDSSAAGTGFIKNLQERVKAMGSEKDLASRQLMQADLERSVGMEKASIEAGLRDNLNLRYNIAGLEEVANNYARMAALTGKADPREASTRAVLTEAKAKVDRDLRTSLATNFRYNSLDATLRAASTVNKQVTSQEDYAGKIGLQIEKSDELARRKQEQAEQEAAIAVSPVVRNRVRELMPELKGQSDEEVAKWLVVNAGKKRLSPELDAVLKEQDPAHLRALAFSGNKAAVKVLAADELATQGSAFAGKSIADVEKFIERAETEVASMGYTKLLQVLQMSEDEKSDLLPYLNAAKNGMATDKNQALAAAQIKANLMQRYMSLKVSDNVAKDLNGWRVAEGPVKDAIEQASKTGTADFGTVTRILMSNTERNKRPDMVRQLQEALDMNTPSSTLFKVDTEAFKRQIQYEAGRGSVAPVVEKFLQGIPARVVDALPNMQWLFGE